MKKAQGLPLNMIVLAVIAALILVLVIAFTIGGAGTFFSKIFKGGITAVGDETSVVQDACRADCTRAQQSVSTVAWKTTSYCTKKANIDRNGDGTLNDTDVPATDEKGLKCWNEPIFVTCSTTIGTTTVSEIECV
jgi:hypothetical protein